MDRYVEAEEAPKAFAELGKQVQMYMKVVDAFKAKVITRSHAWGGGGQLGSKAAGAWVQYGSREKATCLIWC